MCIADHVTGNKDRTRMNPRKCPSPKSKDGTCRLADYTNAGVLEDQHLMGINFDSGALATDAQDPCASPLSNNSEDHNRNRPGAAQDSPCSARTAA